MRIVSLLPALSELVAALRYGEDLVGISHECDYPEEIRQCRRLIRQAQELPSDCASIDAQVSLNPFDWYWLDELGLESVLPDLILTQTQCAVCAVSAAAVVEVANRLSSKPRVLSVNPTDLAGVHAMFREVAEALGGVASARADGLIRGFEETASRIAERIAGAYRPRVLFLEWPDPPFSAGHWMPELIELAGGVCVLGEAGGRSGRVTWAEIAASAPEIAIVAPCGFALERAGIEARVLEARPEWTQLSAVCEGRVAVADGTSYFSRPGPRLEASLRILAAVIHPAPCGEIAEGTEGWSWLSEI